MVRAIRQHHFAELRQLDAAGGTAEERRAQLLFHRLYMFGQRALVYKELLGCRPEIPGLGKYRKLLKIFDLHFLLLQ